MDKPFQPQMYLLVELLTETSSAMPPFANGARALEFGDGIGYGSVYALECASGYRKEGAATILCQSDGHWSSPQPYCESLFLAIV
uniref:Sushi domain-containing protein n=1 Tax=Ditylenchus dipsaci TaxID=166011 RepID=A0A915CYC9_9BILA